MGTAIDTGPLRDRSHFIAFLPGPRKSSAVHSRRSYLAALGTGFAVVTAGCSGDGDDDEQQADGGGSGLLATLTDSSGSDPSTEDESSQSAEDGSGQSAEDGSGQSAENGSDLSTEDGSEETATAVGDSSESDGVAEGVSKLVAPDGEPTDQFGAAVAVHEDTAVVGASRDDDDGREEAGTASVFAADGDSWTRQAKLVPDEAVAKEFFGASVAIEGDTVLVGAESADANHVYVFERSGASWSQSEKLTPPSGRGAAGFGLRVALDGDRALVGAPVAEESAGAAHAFRRSDGSWTHRAELAASDGVAGDRFGDAVALDGDTVLVGAWKSGTDAGAQAGSAYAFALTDSGWEQRAKLTASDAGSYDNFGRDVAVKGDVAFVGAPDIGVYAFDRADGSWTERSKLRAEDTDDGDSFGTSVAVGEDRALVGAAKDTDPNGDRAGSAYVYARGDGDWSMAGKLVAPDDVAEDDDLFGQALSLDGSTALVGALFDDQPNGDDAGSAYAFTLSE